MASTREEIEIWFDQAERAGATHMLVVLDGFEYDDYPVHVLYGEDVQEKIDKYNDQNMQRVMEVYDLSIDKHVQLDQSTAWNTGPSPRREGAR